MDASKLRQRVLNLDEERRKLLAQILRPLGMVSGSLYQMKRKCGHSGCKCTKGELHSSWYLSRLIEGRTKLDYIGRVVPEWLDEAVRRYQNYQNIRARVRKLDSEISECLNLLRDVKVKNFEQAKKEHR